MYEMKAEQCQEHTFLARGRHLDGAREVLRVCARRVRAPPLLAGHQVARRALQLHTSIVTIIVVANDLLMTHSRPEYSTQEQ